MRIRTSSASAWSVAGLLVALAATPGSAADPDTLTLYAIPAPRPLKWSTPRRLALRVVGNEITLEHVKAKHTIGHVFVHLVAPSVGREELTGMTNRYRGEDRALILEHGYGLGVLGADMRGELETPEGLRAELAERAATGRIARLSYTLAPAASARLLTFLDEFRARGHGEHYGGANRPRYGEGGGCSAFGVAFLELAGLIQPELEAAWRVQVRAPYALFGGPLNGLRASARRVLFEGEQWAEAEQPHVNAMFWDPTAIYQWIRATHAAETKAPTGKWQLSIEGRMVGLAADARGVPVPQDPIWLEDPPGTPHPYGRQPSVFEPGDTADRAGSDRELAEMLAAWGDPVGEGALP